jgi:hypothetical protein
MKGELKERKPSGYSFFTLPKDDKIEYLNTLANCLYEAYDSIKEGFKSNENDKKFEILMRSLLSKET